MDETLTVDIIAAVAEARGVDATELTFPLADYIDCDAINRLARHGASSWSLSFELPDHTVTVTSDGAVTVTDPNEELAAN